MIPRRDRQGALERPASAYLAEFERILPGAAERIFAQFETEGNHRRSMEQENARFTARDATVGQALAAVYAASAFGLTAFAIYMDANWVAAILGGGTIVSGVVAFLRRAK